MSITFSVFNQRSKAWAPSLNLWADLALFGAPGATNSNSWFFSILGQSLLDVECLASFCLLTGPQYLLLHWILHCYPNSPLNNTINPQIQRSEVALDPNRLGWIPLSPMSLGSCPDGSPKQPGRLRGTPSTYILDRPPPAIRQLFPRFYRYSYIGIFHFVSSLSSSNPGFQSPIQPNL